MKKVLFPFQIEAVEKLKAKRSRLVGDDMGLGKTIEAIALDTANRLHAHREGNNQKRKTLVVAPLSVLSSWETHLKENTDHRVVVIDRKNRAPFVAAAIDPKVDGYFVCHWESLRLKDMQALRKVLWFHVIGDEIHRIKNRKALQTRSFKGLKTILKSGLSGTPADNNPQDLWSVLNWLWPHYYTSFWKFYNTYIVSELQPEGYRKMIGVKNMDVLHKEMNPWYIRRKKEDVLPDLPDKYYTTVWVDLESKQRKAYNDMKKNMIAWLERPDVKEKIDREDPLVASVIVAQLQRLQQFAVGYMEYVEDKKVKVKKDGVETVVVKPVYRMSEPSSKLDALMEILEDNPSESVVVFSQFKQAINLLSRRLASKGITYGLITGDTPQVDRSQAIEDFQAGKIRVMACTIRAGGVGITLTRASTVVFIDRDWSPAQNKQAEDRLHRIGQESAVQVIDLMARNTVDLGRKQRLMQKWDWLQQILGDKTASELQISLEGEGTDDQEDHPGTDRGATL